MESRSAEGVSRVDRKKQYTLLDSVYSGVDVAIFIVDVTEGHDFVYAGLNPAHERLTGLRSKDVTGKRPEDLVPYVPSEAVAQIQANYRRCLEAGQVIEYEECIPMGGRQTWWFTKLTPLRDAEDRIYRIVGTSLEISDRKQMETALQRSEERFRTLSDEIADGVAVTVEGKNYWVNQAFSDIFGYSKEEMLGQGVDFVIVASEVPALLERMRRRLEGEPVPKRYETFATRKGGERIHIDVTAQRIIFDGHDAIQIIVRDISERKAWEKALAESEERYRALVESSPDAISLVDEQGVFHFMNAEAARRLGGEPSDYVGRAMDVVFPPPIAQRQVTSVREVIVSGKALSTESETVLQGQRRWYRTTIQPLGDSGGMGPMAMIIAADITDLKDAEEALQQASVSRQLVGEMLRDLQALGSLSETDMFQGGQALAQRLEADLLEGYLASFASAGLGTLTLITADTEKQRWVFGGQGLVEVKDSSDRPACNYARGFLCGAIMSATNTARVAGVELQCQSMGDDMCQFVIQVVG